MSYASALLLLPNSDGVWASREPNFNFNFGYDVSSFLATSMYEELVSACHILFSSCHASTTHPTPCYGFSSNDRTASKSSVTEPAMAFSSPLHHRRITQKRLLQLSTSLKTFCTIRER